MDSIQISLPNNTVPPFVPGVSFNGSNFNDPQLACTSNIDSYTTSGCGNYYQAAYGYYKCVNTACPGHYDNTNLGNVYGAHITVSFVGSSTSSLNSNPSNWMAGGISLTSPTSIDGLDLGYEFYAYMDGGGNVGVAWFVIVTCEFPNTLTFCDYGTSNYIDYKVLLSDSTIIPANYATDKIDLSLYWNTNLEYFIFDWRDSNYSPYYWTVKDFLEPGYASNYFYFGVDDVQYFNQPYSDSYGFQMGFASNLASLPSTALIELSNANYNAGPSANSTTQYSVQHAQTIGMTPTGGGPHTASYYGDAYWHDNWVWGGLVPGSDMMTPIEVTPINAYAATASQVNGQIFTASGSGDNNPECVSVTNFNAIQSDAESAGEGNAPLGGFIWGHPFANGLWWNVVNSGSCSYLTWAWTDYKVPDNTQLW